MSESSRSFRLPAVLRVLRPAQWVKNGVVAAAYVFARWDPSQAARAAGVRPIVDMALAVAAFCLVSGAVYVMNDLKDIEADRRHPIKRLRPLASGELAPGAAKAVCALCLALASAVSFFLPWAFGALLGGYALMQVAYTYFLKRVSYVDVFVISIGFVMRAAAGALALTVRISPWLLLCTFLLSLFLALCKRRHEKVLLEDEADGHRAALAGYDRQLLDLQIGVTASATLVCYAIYTLSAETVARFHTNRLGLTIPFVVFGLFRYLELVYRHDAGGRPEKVLLTDKVMICTVLSYLATVVLIFATL